MMTSMRQTTNRGILGFLTSWCFFSQIQPPLSSIPPIRRQTSTMSITQFSMVEELASLIKDNLPSRHLVLAVEEALVNYLQDHPSPNGILELEPMNSYNRLILHRLADIFGFAHESVGEGDDRHLVLQRCLETSIPSILVSDILWQHDACESPPMPYQLLRRDDTSTMLKMDKVSSPNFLEREEAYLAARERIFGTDDVGLKDAARQKPRPVPIVARRMIAHALGQRISQCSEAKGVEGQYSSDMTDIRDIETRIEINLDLQSETSKSSEFLDRSMRCIRAEANALSISPSALHSGKVCHEVSDRETSGVSPRLGGRDDTGISRTSMGAENVGAARRMFAHALGRQASKNTISRCREVKSVTK